MNRWIVRDGTLVLVLGVVRVSCAARYCVIASRFSKEVSMRTINDGTIKYAVEITKAAITPMNPGTHHISNPEAVAKFIETIANKLEDLRIGPAPH